MEELQLQQQVLLAEGRVRKRGGQAIGNYRVVLVNDELLEELVKLIPELLASCDIPALEPGDDELEHDHLVDLVTLGLLDLVVVDHQVQLQLVQ